MFSSPDRWLDDLPVSRRLRDELRAWAREWERLLGNSFEVTEKEAYAAWLEVGHRHTRHLQAELGPDWQVEYTAD